MKNALLTIVLFLCCLCTFGRHIKGGFFTYQYLGPGTNDPTALNYKVWLTVYMDCTATGNQIDGVINFTIYQGSTSTQYGLVSVAKKTEDNLQKFYDDPCITGNQAECYYKVVVYELASIELPASPSGYTLSYQRCCRIEQMDNISNSGDVGNTYTIQIPGSASLVPNANKNSSPTFPVNDTAVICQGNPFFYPFSATDPDGDSLSYALCTSYLGADKDNPAPAIATAPPYNSVPYTDLFNGSTPMGTQVTINSKTGLISGIAPNILNTGEYAVTVCVSEYRNGVYFAQTRKELHIKVKDCSAIKAFLNPIPTSCDGFSVNFKNDAAGGESGTEYYWNFGDPGSGTKDTSTSATPVHVYSDTGQYKLFLRVSIGGQCSDSTTTIVKVYPGFFPGFRVVPPLCKGATIQFIDTTRAKYGKVTGWQWDFGNTAATDDTISNVARPRYIYPDAGVYDVKLIVGSTFGCLDTVVNSITITNSPVLTIVPRDTLICTIDTLQIKTVGPGTFAWSPDYNISSLTSGNPFVSPDVSTTYYVTYTEAVGCFTTDSVVVNVVSHVTLNLGPDTSICRTDGIPINISSDALNYIWTPATYLSSDTAKQPIATPLDPSITYQVVGSIGKCTSSDNITIKTNPYPVAYAGRDTTICFGFSEPLSASGGTSYVWSPPTFLTATNVPNPVSTKPTSTTQYVVAVYGQTGCPKPGLDTVIVNVDPEVIANAGPADTMVVLGQPLQLNGTGGVTYEWSPSTWLSATNIATPVSSPEDNITYLLTAKSESGCRDTDTIHVKLYKVPPSFYVPTGFSPNNDFNNDILKPILLGMRSLDYFRVYDRWGKEMFFTAQIGEGWDGTFKGNPQDPGTYVWMARGTTYLGQVITKKGYVVLLR